MDPSEGVCSTFTLVIAVIVVVTILAFVMTSSRVRDERRRPDGFYGDGYDGSSALGTLDDSGCVGDGGGHASGGDGGCGGDGGGGGGD